MWWEGKDGEAPAKLHRLAGPARGSRASRRRRPRTPTAASPRPPTNNPALSPKAETTRNGVPITAIIFGGRRATTVPLVFQAFNWEHGVYVGATMGSETTAAAAGQVGEVRRDPMAMLPFCGYNMGDYFEHWLGHAAAASRTRPRSSTSTGSARTRTASSSGPASARTCACSSGSSIAWRASVPAPGDGGRPGAARRRSRHAEPRRLARAISKPP